MNRKKDSVKKPVGRLETLDLIRGLTLISMILYHGMWDFLYLSETGTAMEGLRSWYEGPGGHLWQQSICRTFILLSGFCVPFSRRIFRRGLQVFAGGLAVSAVTLLFMYEERVLFGVLTFLGTAMLLTGALRACGVRLRTRKEAAVTLLLCLLLFHITRWVNIGFLRLGPTGTGLKLPLPSALYLSARAQETAAGRLAGFLLTGLGFPMQGFFSTDYFSLVPWIFLFWTGVSLHRLLTAWGRGGAQASNREKGGSRDLFRHPLFHIQIPLLNWIGRHSLLVYLLHQPVLYLLVTLVWGS